jgi:hypothetical protein
VPAAAQLAHPIEAMGAGAAGAAYAGGGAAKAWDAGGSAWLEAGKTAAGRAMHGATDMGAGEAGG